MADNQKTLSALITVAMPIYNAGEYLDAAVDSIISQTYTNWELLIIDDGSTDNAIKNIELIKDNRIRVLSDGFNKGLAARLNEAIGLANGQFFARMDQDDISMPDRFNLQISALKDNSNLDLVASRVNTINSQSKITGQLPFASTHQQICAKPWRGFYLPHPTWMGKVEWFRKNRYAFPAPFFCEDQELLLRTYKESQFECLEQVLLHYRVRDTTNLFKAIRTRWALLKCQFKAFNKHDFKFIGLAIIIFILRILKDFLKKITEFNK